VGGKLPRVGSAEGRCPKAIRVLEKARQRRRSLESGDGRMCCREGTSRPSPNTYVRNVYGDTVGAGANGELSRRYFHDDPLRARTERTERGNTESSTMTGQAHKSSRNLSPGEQKKCPNAWFHAPPRGTTVGTSGSGSSSGVVNADTRRKGRERHHVSLTACTTEKCGTPPRGTCSVTACGGQETRRIQKGMPGGRPEVVLSCDGSHRADLLLVDAAEHKKRDQGENVVTTRGRLTTRGGEIANETREKSRRGRETVPGSGWVYVRKEEASWGNSKIAAVKIKLSRAMHFSTYAPKRPMRWSSSNVGATAGR